MPADSNPFVHLKNSDPTPLYRELRDQLVVSGVHQLRGSLTRPMKRTLPVRTSRIMKRKGWSALRRASGTEDRPATGSSLGAGFSYYFPFSPTRGSFAPNQANLTECRLSDIAKIQLLLPIDSAAIQEAEEKFRRVQGFRDIEKLMKALEGFEAEDEAVAKRVA